MLLEGGPRVIDRIRLTIPPAAVSRYFIRRRPQDKVIFAARGALLPRYVRRGGWDRGLPLVQEHPVYQLMAAFLRHDFDPERCRGPLVRYYIARGEGKSSARAHAERRLVSYLAAYRALYEDMREHGYRAEASEDQVGVAIDRSGCFVKVAEGHHRFALAHLLGLNRMTAELRFVHSRWYRLFAGRLAVPSRTALTAAVDAAVARVSGDPSSGMSDARD